MAQRAAKLVGSTKDWENNTTLAAAFAEDGLWEKAVANQKKCLEDNSLDKIDRKRMEKRLKLFQNEKPYRLDE